MRGQVPPPGCPSLAGAAICDTTAIGPMRIRRRLARCLLGEGRLCERQAIPVQQPQQASAS